MSEWIMPALTHDIDVERYLRHCPATATTQGIFFQQLTEAVEKHPGSIPPGLYAGLTQRRRIAFSRYPLREFMRLAVNAATILHPRQPLAEAIRRVGRLAYSGFASTMAGRVVLFALGDSIDDIIGAVPKAYSVTIPDSTVTVRRIDGRRVVFEFLDVYCFVDTYHRGVIEGAMVDNGAPPPHRRSVRRAIVRRGLRHAVLRAGSAKGDMWASTHLA